MLPFLFRSDEPLGHGSRRQTLMVSGLLSKHRPMVLSLVWHRACLCCVPLPHVTEHCDHGPTLHWVGQGCRLHGLRVSGRSSLQCLLWMARVVLSSDGWTQLTERTCIPVFPHGLLQFCHSPVTQMGGGQGFWLQSLVSPLGFMLDLLQKLLWTILLSTFLLQPYRRLCFPPPQGLEQWDHFFGAHS